MEGGQLAKGLGIARVEPAKRIVVIGSANMDLVCRIPRLPRPGQTLLGENLLTIPGGKGANQAIAASRLSEADVDVYLVARVGEDDFGTRLLNGLAQHRVRTEFVTITEGIATGCAMILVDRKGENSIVVAPGANARLTPGDIDRVEPIISGASAVLLQLEIPIDTVKYAIAVCRRLGVFTILDPAPVPPGSLPASLFAVDVLTPNQGEAELLLGRRRTHRVSAKKVDDPKLLAGGLLSLGTQNVVLKLGHKGALLVTRSGQIARVKPFRVEVADTTAAGDAFSGALAVGYVEGMPLPQAVRFANAAGAACCMQFGAQPALPSRDIVQGMMQRAG